MIRVFQPQFVLNIEFAAVPEPATALMVGFGLLLLSGWRRMQNRRLLLRASELSV